MPVNTHWSDERWDTLVKQLCADFGPASAAKIVETIVYTIGGERITMPSIQDLEKRERNRKICDSFRGNYQESAGRFGLSVSTIHRTIMKQRMINRTPKENDLNGNKN